MTLDMATEPKSDQMNADDFIGGQIKTITIADVKSSGSGEQPISIHYEGDNGKPYKPCKSMRRVMVHGWGADGLQFIGKSMTLFCDPSVKWAGKEVGGIRISHMSHIDNEINVALTASKGKRKLHQVKPLKVDMGNVDPEIDYQELMKKAQDSASYGVTEYQEYFMSLTASDKKRLNDSGDHEKLKTIAKSHDEQPTETEASPSNEPDAVDVDEAGGDGATSTPDPSVEQFDKAPLDTETDKDKKLSCNEIIAVIEISPTVESVDDFVHLHSNFIEKMSKQDRQDILGATNSRKAGLRNV